MKISVHYPGDVTVGPIEIHSLDDVFKLFEPYFDIKNVEEIGIVTGKWYWTVYEPQKLSQRVDGDWNRGIVTTDSPGNRTPD